MDGSTQRCLFGKKKLSVFPGRLDIRKQSDFLRLFGAVATPGALGGLPGSAERFWREARKRYPTDEWEQWYGYVQYLALKVPDLWLYLARFLGENDERAAAVSAYQKFVEADPSNPDGWRWLATAYERIGNDEAALQASVSRALTPTATMDDISWAANRVNSWSSEHQRVGFGRDERRLLVQPLIDVMQHRRNEASAVDYSRLAWLQVGIGEEAEARTSVQSGLAKDATNGHLQKLAQRLNRA